MEALIARLLAGPEDVELTDRELAMLKAHLSKRVPASELRDGWQEREKLRAILNFNRNLAAIPSASLGPAKPQPIDDPLATLSAEDRAIAILAREPTIRSIAAVAKLAGCSRQHLSDATACPRFATAWEASQRANYRQPISGSKSDGTVEAWE